MINIITLHDICNPGSVFQAYALNRYVYTCGFKCNVIDYVPSYSHIGNRKLKGIIKNIIFGRTQKKIKRKYRNFISENMYITEKKYSKYADLVKNPPEADLYVSGSDQLWNRTYDCGNDEAFYLSFIHDRPKISYATSLGKKDISEEDVHFIAERIKDYKYISVRERSSCLLLESALDKKVQWVCDPVFLLDRDDYKKFVTPRVVGRYIVVYLAAASELLESVISLARKRGYKVVLLGGNITRCSCDVHVKDMGPEDFLSYICFADVIISSSFHATAFAHIFEKKFGVILPHENGERIESLLSISNLENHIIDNVDNISIAFESIDFNEVSKKLLPFILSSKEFLNSALEESYRSAENGI